MPERPEQTENEIAAFRGEVARKGRPAAEVDAAVERYVHDLDVRDRKNANPPYAEDKETRCKCGHERSVHAGHDGLGRCALRSCPTICGEFRRKAK